jgi:FkbM family methyltransferase
MTKKRSLEELRAGARALLGEGKAQDARTAYERICSHKNCSADDWFRLGIISGQLGLFDESVRCCKNAVQMNPGHSAAYYGLGMALHAKGELEGAAQNLSTAIRLDPGNKEAISRYRVVMREASQDKRLMIQIKDGVSICVPETLDCLTTYVLLEQEDWFENEIKFIRTLLQAGECALDIGANYGAYTNVMASKVGSSGAVYAFEPASETAAYLRESIEINACANIALKQVALSNYSGSARLQTGMISECNRLLHEDESAVSEVVEVVTLDEAMGGVSCGDISFVKIDAEGEEKQVLEGGNVFFTNYSPLIMLEIKDADRVNLHLIDQLGIMGYSPYRLVPGLNLLVPFGDEDDAGSFQLNLLFCKPDKLEELKDRKLLIAPSSQEETCAQAADTVNAFQRLVQDLPYYGQFKGLWSSEGASALPGGGKYLDGLNQYALSRATPASREQSYGSLAMADVKVTEAYQLYATLPRAISLVRIKYELGYQSDAATILKWMVDRIDAMSTTDLQEPFIPVASRYEAIDPAGRMLEWVKSSILEQWEYIHSFTSFSDGVELPGSLEKLIELGYCGAEIERRYQLKKLQTGLQEKPEFNEKLAGERGLCLNEAFWKAGNIA